MQNKIDKITDILRRDDGISGAMHYCRRKNKMSQKKNKMSYFCDKLSFFQP
ncbi:hypothetical protein GN870_02315 [Campylobacter coli]|nr:hypothetical protein [Campylobacter coli]